MCVCESTLARKKSIFGVRTSHITAMYRCEYCSHGDDDDPQKKKYTPEIIHMPDIVSVVTCARVRAHTHSIYRYVCVCGLWCVC